MRSSGTRHIHVEHVMGTVVSLDVRGPAPDPGAVDAALAWLHRVDATFSPFRPDSAVRRMDRGVASDDPDVRWVVARCAALREETGGFFDAAAGGTFDPSALVKGWSVQRAADRLVAAGVRDLCLAAGGDIAVRGEAAPGRPWRIGVRHPDDAQVVAAVVTAPGGTAVATSGTYERGLHIRDPHTGRAPRGLRSVTVVGPDLGTADAYATAAFAMGADGPRWTAGLAGYESLSILDDDTVLTTAGFPQAA